MFEINHNLKIVEETILGSKIYCIDNFYKNPEEVADYIFNRSVPLWKIGQVPSYNNVYFNDKRLIKDDSRIIKVYEFLSDLCGGKIHYGSNGVSISTNMTRFAKSTFNDYKNCFWWPHLDSGYNGVVYFNKDDENSGTNLYHPNVMKTFEWEYKNSITEHYLCWRPKDKYNLLKSYKSKYNSLCLFDGSKFPHGMNICNDKFFSDIPISHLNVDWKYYRSNQVFFLF